MTRSLAPWALVLLLLGCHTPREGFEAARTRLEQGDLVGALVQLDQVAPTDPDYAESRSLAMAIERRIRTSQRLFARGLALRAQWRDEEAISYFELARQVWPRDESAAALIEATRNRMTALEGDTDDHPEVEDAGAVATTQPIGDDGEEHVPEIVGPSTEMAPVAGEVEPEPGEPDDPPAVAVGPPMAGETGPEAVDPGDVPAVPAGETVPTREEAEVPSSGSSAGSETQGSDVLLRARLGQAQAALRRGGLEDALRILEQVHTSHPDSREVTALLVRVLHQRALLHYGQGELAMAVDVWSKLLAIEPDHSQAREFHAAARSELDALKRR